MRFTKIKKTKERKIFLEYQDKNTKGEYDNYSFECGEEPLPEFNQALQALAPDILSLCEIPIIDDNRITIKSISMSYGGDLEVMGASICGAMELRESNCPLNLNTPYKASDSYSGGPADSKQILDGKTVKKIEMVCK